MPELGGGRRRTGSATTGRSPCVRADHGDVELVVGLTRSSSRGVTASTLGGERLGVALHLEVHADLEQLQRRQLADRLGAGQLLEDVERALRGRARESGAIAIVNQRLNSWLRR